MLPCWRVSSGRRVKARCQRSRASMILPTAAADCAWAERDWSSLERVRRPQTVQLRAPDWIVLPQPWQSAGAMEADDMADLRAVGSGDDEVRAAGQFPGI